jgi:hypothetical protein
MTPLLCHFTYVTMGNDILKKQNKSNQFHRCDNTKRG